MKPIYSLSALCLLLLLFLPSRSLNAANDLTTYPYGGTVVNKHLKEPFIGQLVSIHFPEDAFLMATTFSETLISAMLPLKETLIFALLPFQITLISAKLPFQKRFVTRTLSFQRRLILNYVNLTTLLAFPELISRRELI